MRLLAIICPPLAVLLVGKPFSAILNLFLTFCLWIPGAIHAWGVVSDSQATQRHNQLLHTLRRPPAL